MRSLLTCARERPFFVEYQDRISDYDDSAEIRFSYARRREHINAF